MEQCVEKYFCSQEPLEFFKSFVLESLKEVTYSVNGFQNKVKIQLRLFSWVWLLPKSLP